MVYPEWTDPDRQTAAALRSQGWGEGARTDEWAATISRGRWDRPLLWRSRWSRAGVNRRMPLNLHTNVVRMVCFMRVFPRVKKKKKVYVYIFLLAALKGWLMLDRTFHQGNPLKAE